MTGRLRFGAVSAFDEARGLGEVTGDGGTVWPFHCTAIADGTRRIDLGARVVFCLVPGHLGRTEARELTEVG